MGKTIGIILGVVALALAVWLGITLIDVDQTKEGELPSVTVDVDADGGELPEFEANVGDIDVGTETETVLVPEVVLVEEEVEVPTVDIETPEEDAAEDAGEPEED